jgi:hypothetical protein
MNLGKSALRTAFVLLLGILSAFSLLAQTSTTGRVIGTVTDATGAVVPKAEVELLNTATNVAQTSVTDAAGGYSFANVVPGTYRLTVKLAGFRTATVSALTVEVNKSADVPIHLEVGGDKEVVEVTATATAQLQTTDAQLGNTLSTDNILRLPTLQRNATELMNLQPGVVAGGNGIMMRVSGAIDDQNTVTLDGIDITQNLVATNTSIPTPADSVEEFRASVSNQGATMARSSGGQITLIGRRGSNEWHWAVYEYLQNTDLNANTWDNNRVGQPTAIIHDNRYGGRIGGAIKKNKTFFFDNYEARRFNSVYQTNRTVPTATLRQGIVQIQGPNGVEQFNLKTANVCGPNGNQACDPRGLGMSPSVSAQFAQMPLPNLNGIGDGLNTSGYFVNVGVPTDTDFGVMRLDHIFNEKFTFNGSFTYYRIDQVGANQACNDISILNGNASCAVTNPGRAVVPTAQLTWQVSPTLINVFRAGWVRDTSQGNATSPTKAAGIVNTPGSQTAAGPVALLIGSGVSSFIDSPIDMDTQRARFQAAWQQDWQWIDDVTKIWGKHQFQFGAQVNKIPFTHARADKVIGSLTSLVATIDGNQTYLTIPSTNTPVACSGSVSANCIPSNQATNWGRYYASLLGMVDNVNVLSVRNANLQPQPLGTYIRDVTNQWATYMYAQDSWRIRPDLTLYYGVSYGWQTSPTEQNNLQTVMVNAATGQPITGPQYLQSKLQAATQGQIYNPTFGFATVGASHLPIYNVDYGSVGPRASLAWNPSASSGILNKIFGERKTVVRGGFAIVYDRSNTVQSVEIPMLGIGFDQNIIVQAPLCNATGPGGAGCSPGVGNANPGLSSFRVGVDGTLPLPTPSAATSPIIPAPGAETLSFQVDPNAKTGRSYNFDFSLQRELPGSMILEVAYVGRAGRDLPQAVNLNSAPYMFLDSGSGQTFAQAYDAIANALRTGKTAPVEPWFENQFPGLAKAQGTASATAYIVGRNSANIIQGNVGSLFLNLDTYRRQLGLQAYNSDQAQVEFLRTYIGYSNYNAGIITLTKRMSHGFTISGNYTLSKALDDGLSNQNNAGFFSNSFNPAVQYGPSSYDRRSVFNFYYQYDLPAGKGHKLGGNAVVNAIFGGWYTSGIFTGWTGAPLKVAEGSQVWGGGSSVIGATDYMVPTSTLPSSSLNTSVGPSTCSNSLFNGSVATSLNKGTGLDMFSNPGAAYCSFGYIQLSSTGRTGSANPMRGLGFWNFDTRLGKTTSFGPEGKYKLGYSADFFNIFNHHNFLTPSPSFTSPATFGVITSTYTPPNRTNSARWIEMGLRLDF